MWTTWYILSQVSVCLAVLSLALSAMTKNRILILIFAISNSFFFGLQYLFLGQFSGAILNFIGIIRGVWYYLNERFNVKGRKAAISLVVCLTLLVVGEILTFSAWYSIFPLIATTTYTVGVWQKDIKLYRWAIVVAETFGVAYNIMVHSLLGIVLEGILLVIALVSVVRIYVHERQIKKHQAGTVEANEL